MAAENNWVGSIEYLYHHDQADGFDVEVGALVGSVGYKILLGDSFYVFPEVRLGVGVVDDNVSIYGVETYVELDTFFAVEVRGQYELENGVHLFVAPTLAEARVSGSTSFGGENLTIYGGSWSFGAVAGIGYKLFERASAELAYKNIDGADIYGVGLRFGF